MKIKTLFILSFLILLLSCTKEKSVTGPETPNTVPSQQDLAKFQIIQIYYDSLEIKSDRNITLSTKAVKKIILGDKKDGNFTGLDSLDPQFMSDNNKYYLNFQFKKKIDRTLITYDFTLRFLLDNNEIIDVDTTAQMFKYPYQSAEVFITVDEVLGGILQSKNYFQDFDLNDNYLFIRPIGPSGLFRYNILSREAK